MNCEVYLVINASDCDYHIYEFLKSSQISKSHDSFNLSGLSRLEEYGLHRTKHREQLKNLWNRNEDHSITSKNTTDKNGVFDFMDFLQPTRIPTGMVVVGTNKSKLNITLITCIRYEITEKYAQLLIALSNGHIYVKYFRFVQFEEGSINISASINRLSSVNSYDSTVYRMLLLHGAISCMQFVNTRDYIVNSNSNSNGLSDIVIIGRVTDGEVAI